ncbi:MAG: sigma-70 family RNA polymerase sigma factor [Nocardioides sp.]|uniref:RNA polymerase sigma factor n=1 Tax=Nocardioides sp. TaxID=35761 RepID=UPI0039E4A8CC
MARTIAASEFEQLYRATATEVLGYVRRRGALDAEDLVAEVYAIAWRRRADLPSALLRRAWLFGTARRLLLTDARRRDREKEVGEDAAARPDPAPDAEREHTCGVVTAALGRLRPDDRELIQLVEWERMTTAEVSVVLGIRPGTARVRLHRIRRALAADPELRDLVAGRSGVSSAAASHSAQP